MRLVLIFLLLPPVFLSACAPLAWLSRLTSETEQTQGREPDPKSTPSKPAVTLPYTKLADAPSVGRDEKPPSPPTPRKKPQEDKDIALLTKPYPGDAEKHAADEPVGEPRENSVPGHDEEPSKARTPPIGGESATAQPPEQPISQPTIPMVVNDRVRHFVDLYSKRQRIHFTQALARSGKYVPRMVEILREENVPEELVYIAFVESGFSPTARSASNAVGLWQFIRSTGAHYGLKIDWWVDERRDPFKATRAAAAYFKDLYQRFGRWYLAAAAYNAGGGALAQAMDRSGAKDFWSLSAKSDLSEETRNFVPKFIAASLIAQKPARYGLDQIAYEPRLDYDRVEIHNALRLDVVARLAQTTVAVIRELNPALLRNYTPPAKDGYSLRVPAGKGNTFLEAYNRDHRRSHERVLVHQIKSGETLSGIAKKYGTRVSRLMEENGLKNHRIRSGEHLIVVAREASKRR